MKKVKIIRENKGFTQKQLAEKSNLSQAYINELENGKKKNPSYEVLKNIAKALNVAISDLLDDNSA